MALAVLLPAATRVQAPPPALPALHGEAIVADAARGRVVLFGGRTSRGWLSGTWEWDGGVWHRAVDSTASPPPRGGHALAYDGVSGRVFLFGGMAGRGGATLLRDVAGDGLLYFGGYNDSLLADFWALDARGWRRLAR